MTDQKSKQAIDEAADKARKAKVDRANKKKAEAAAKKAAEMSETPLNAEELAFIERTAPKLKEGRAIMQPSPAEMLRYSELIKRKDVGKKTITD